MSEWTNSAYAKAVEYFQGLPSPALATPEDPTALSVPKMPGVHPWDPPTRGFLLEPPAAATTE